MVRGWGGGSPGRPWEASTSEEPGLGVRLLDSADSDSVRFRDGAGNPIARVPAGYDDDPARLFTFEIQRSNPKHTLLNLQCISSSFGSGGGGWKGYLWHHDVPLPPGLPPRGRSRTPPAAQ